MSPCHIDNQRSSFRDKLPSPLGRCVRVVLLSLSFLREEEGIICVCLMRGGWWKLETHFILWNLRAAGYTFSLLSETAHSQQVSGSACRSSKIKIASFHPVRLLLMSTSVDRGVAINRVRPGNSARQINEPAMPTADTENLIARFSC